MEQEGEMSVILSSLNLINTAFGDNLPTFLDACKLDRVDKVFFTRHIPCIWNKDCGITGRQGVSFSTGSTTSRCLTWSVPSITGGCRLNRLSTETTWEAVMMAELRWWWLELEVLGAAGKPLDS